LSDQLPPDGTRERLLRAALELFADKGFQSTSVADILQRAGAHYGSLYHFFPTKQHVLLAVLEGYRDGIEAMLLQPAWNGISDPIEKIFALLASYRRALVASDCTYGCPIGSLALELHEPDPAVRELLAANFSGWVGHVQRCLEAAKPRLPKGADVRQLAVFILSVMEGAVMQARTHRNITSFDDSVAALRQYFSCLPRPATRRKR
jgi:TetR/AcrR family transcriptional regulator, transcriptional repressor for nem operon